MKESFFLIINFVIKRSFINNWRSKMYDMCIYSKCISYENCVNFFVLGSNIVANTLEWNMILHLLVFPHVCHISLIHCKHTLFKPHKINIVYMRMIHNKNVVQEQLVGFLITGTCFLWCCWTKYHLVNWLCGKTYLFLK